MGKGGSVVTRNPITVRSALLLSALVLMVSGVSGAHAAAIGDWEATGLSGRVFELFTPAAGALFAKTEQGLFRSDDAGSTWAPVPLPPLPADVSLRFLHVAVDPTDQSVWYSGGDQGIYKTTNAASWSLILPTPEREFSRAIGIAPSAADVNLVYLALSGVFSGESFRFLRSRDGGVTWERLEQEQNTLCGWSVLILQPHPTDVQRVFRTANCYAGRNLEDALDQSTDQGGTWSTLLRPERSFPSWLVGGRGSAPNRFYLAANRDARAGGSSLFRSDDDGARWREVLTFRGGGTLEQPEAPNVNIGGLAYDQLAPDRVYVALNEYMGHSDRRRATASWVRTSSDGGSTWADLGGQDLPEIHDLALGIDGQNLYAATEAGLWRLSVTTPTPPPPDGREPVVVPPPRPPPVQVPRSLPRTGATESWAVMGLLVVGGWLLAVGGAVRRGS
jgi:hypothetical protein